MALIPKDKFKWREPKAFVEERDRKEKLKGKWWHGALGVIVVAAAMIPIWYLATLNPRKTPVAFEIAVLLGLLLGIFLVYVVPWMIRFCPSEIRLTDKMLLMLRGNRHRSIKWSDIESYCFTQSQGFLILQLKTRQEARLRIGLDQSVQLNDLGQFLSENGLEQSRSEQDAADQLPAR